MCQWLVGFTRAWGAWLMEVRCSPGGLLLTEGLLPSRRPCLPPWLTFWFQHPRTWPHPGVCTVGLRGDCWPRWAGMWGEPGAGALWGCSALRGMGGLGPVKGLHVPRARPGGMRTLAWAPFPRWAGVYPWGLPLMVWDGVFHVLPAPRGAAVGVAWRRAPAPSPRSSLGCCLSCTRVGAHLPFLPVPGARGPAQGGAHLPWMSGVLAQALVVGLQGGALGQRGAPDGQCQPVGTQRRAGALSLGPTGAGLRARLHRGEGEVVGGLDRGFWRGCGFWEPSQGVVSGLGQPGPVRGSLVETNDCNPQAWAEPGSVAPGPVTQPTVARVRLILDSVVLPGVCDEVLAGCGLLAAVGWLGTLRHGLAGPRCGAWASGFPWGRPAVQSSSRAPHPRAQQLGGRWPPPPVLHGDNGGRDLGLCKAQVSGNVSSLRAPGAGVPLCFTGGRAQMRGLRERKQVGPADLGSAVSAASWAWGALGRAASGPVFTLCHWGWPVVLSGGWTAGQDLALGVG